MLYNLYNEIGFSVCHQLPSRSIFIDGVKMPVDARMTGMFVGFVITIVFLLFLYSRASSMPPRNIIIIGIVSIAFLAFDGITSYAHLRETNNVIRLSTGFPVGIFMALMLQSAFNDTKTDATEQKVLSSTKHQIWLLAITLVTFALIIGRFSFLKYVLPPLIIAGVISSFLIVNLTVFNMISSKRPVNLLFSSAMVALELGAAYKLHSLVLPYISNV